MQSEWTVHRIAEFIGVSDRTIERWWKKGVIPDCAFRNDAGAKVWTGDQVREILKIRLQRQPKSVPIRRGL